MRLRWALLQEARPGDRGYHYGAERLGLVEGWRRRWQDPRLVATALLATASLLTVALVSVPGPG